MKQIVINENDVQDLIKSLELEKFKIFEEGKGLRLTDMIHRKFHYVVVSWVQKHGSSWPH